MGLIKSITQPPIPPYKDMPYKGSTSMRSLRNLKVGGGDDVLIVNAEGFFMGADNFTDAPLSIDYDGNITASSLIIGDGAIGTAQLADEAVTAGKIKTGDITATQIASGTITTTQIKAGTIVTGDIAANTITGGNIAADTIDTGELKADCITTAKIDAGAVGTTEIANTAITTAKITDANITEAKIGSLAVTAAKIGTGAITEAKIGSLAVTNAKIANATIAYGKIASVDADTISTGSLDATYIKMKGNFDWYVGANKKGTMGIDSDDNLKIVSDSDDLELKWGTGDSCKWYIGGTMEMYYNGDGDLNPRSNNTNQIGVDAVAWKRMDSYDFHDHCLWLDEEDDLKIVNDCKPKMKKNKIVRNEDGKPQLDHYSLPDWIHDGNSLRKYIARKEPETRNKIKELQKKIDKSSGDRLKKLKKQKEELEEEYTNYNLTEEEIIERTGRSLGHFVDVLAGAIRQLDKKVTKLEQKISDNTK